MSERFRSRLGPVTGWLAALALVLLTSGFTPANAAHPTAAPTATPTPTRIPPAPPATATPACPAGSQDIDGLCAGISKSSGCAVAVDGSSAFDGGWLLLAAAVFEFARRRRHMKNRSAVRTCRNG